MPDFVVLWNNPEGVERKEREWFETRAEAEAAMEKWKITFPWNTYWLAEIVAVQAATSEQPRHIITYAPSGDIKFSIG